MARTEATRPQHGRLHDDRHNDVTDTAWAPMVPLMLTEGRMGRLATAPARGLSEGDVMFALALGPIFLRINSIELGLKHILDHEMGRSVPKKHDLVILWNRLTDEWKEKVAEASCVPLEDLRETLGHYKDAAVTLRYGGPLGEQTGQPPMADAMRKNAAVLQKVANALEGRAHAAIELREVEPRELEG
ncbi:MAG: hypothetical protein OXC91_05795 [Rhodobacteraceae bacterium]|nr:hypothetical protein [Paracoccaceae bacterium]